MRLHYMLHVCLVCGEVRSCSHCLLFWHEMSRGAIFLQFLQISSDLNPARTSWDALSSRSSEIDFYSCK